MTKRLFTLSLLLTGIGLILSILSATDLCNFGGCTEAHQYRFHTVTLPILGMVYFGLLATAQILSSRLALAGLTTTLLLAGGAGAELTMIHLQKNVIQAWCPLCLGIAGVVYLLCILRTFRYFRELGRSSVMKKRLFANSLLVALVALAGFLISFTGIMKMDATADQHDFSVGRSKGPVEVYVFSDWFCPVCQKVEPVIEAAFPTLSQKAKVTFVDKAIHPESMNFVPYHLSFAVNEKEKYLQLRRVLFAVARKTKNPTLTDITSAIAPLKVTYKQLSFMEVTQQMGKFQALSGQFKVNATPTMVFFNTKTNKSKALVGGNEITAEGIAKALKNVE